MFCPADNFPITCQISCRTFLSRLCQPDLKQLFFFWRRAQPRHIPPVAASGTVATDSLFGSDPITTSASKKRSEFGKDPAGATFSFSKRRRLAVDTQTMAEEPTVDIDPKGDLFLETSTEDFESKRFRVCSRALRRQSPVWEQMLFGPWKESKPADGKEWVVHLVGDPAGPLEIVLSIIHGKFDTVPDRLPIETLHQLLIITNKYDITSIVRPWRGQWLKEASTAHRCLVAQSVVKSLYIAWELGDEHLFALRLENISLNTEVDDDGRLCYQGFIDLNEEEYLGPQSVLGKFSRRAYGLVTIGVFLISSDRNNLQNSAWLT